MRNRPWFGLAAAAAGLGFAFVSFWGSLGDLFPAGDYPGPPCVGCDSAGPPIAFLVHGHVSGFFATEPFMGSVSLLLRAPFVALVDWSGGDAAVQYRIGTLVLFLATAMLLLPAIRLMLERGQQPMVVLVAVAAIVVGPATFKAVRWGHPEELLGAALAVAAVLAAGHRRAITAGVLLGLAIATQQWGVFAVLPALMLARGQRRRLAVAGAITAAVFILPMLIAAPARFIHQNFETAVAQLGVTPTNVWWVFHRSGFDPSIHQPLQVIPNALRVISHPLVVALVLGLSLLYWRRSANRHPYDAVQLLALFFLIRCVLDPLTISYHHVPFVLTMAIYEGLRRRGVPVLTLTSAAAILVIESFLVPLNNSALMNAVYLGWALTVAAYLTLSLFGRRINSRWRPGLLDQHPPVQPALAH